MTFCKTPHVQVFTKCDVENDQTTCKRGGDPTKRKRQEVVEKIGRKRQSMRGEVQEGEAFNVQDIKYTNCREARAQGGMSTLEFRMYHSRRLGRTSNINN